MQRGSNLTKGYAKGVNINLGVREQQEVENTFNKVYSHILSHHFLGYYNYNGEVTYKPTTAATTPMPNPTNEKTKI
jgi:hypothetical protein